MIFLNLKWGIILIEKYLKLEKKIKRKEKLIRRISEISEDRQFNHFDLKKAFLLFLYAISIGFALTSYATLFFSFINFSIVILFLVSLYYDFITMDRINKKIDLISEKMSILNKEKNAHFHANLEGMFYELKSYKISNELEKIDDNLILEILSKYKERIDNEDSKIEDLFSLIETKGKSKKNLMYNV